MTITTSAVPAHVNHDSLAQDFTVPATNDLNLIGSYPITVQAEIIHFLDHTKTITST